MATLVMNRDLLIEQHLPYVRKIACDIACRLSLQIELEELVAYGHLGLVRAADRYNPTRGVSFITFAHYYIKGAIWDEVRRFVQWRHLSPRLRAEANASDIWLTKATENTENENFGLTLDDEIGETREQLELLAPIYFLALEQDEHDVPDADSLQFAERLEHEALVATLQRLVWELPEDDRKIIHALYFEGQSAAEYASRAGLSRSWASRLHARAIQKLRAAMQREGWLTDEAAVEA